MSKLPSIRLVGYGDSKTIKRVPNKNETYFDLCVKVENVSKKHHLLSHEIIHGRATNNHDGLIDGDPRKFNV